MKNDDDIIPAFKDIAARREDAIHIMTDTFFDLHAPELVALAVEAGLPTTGNHREFRTAGGLLNYGASIEAALRIQGTYASGQRGRGSLIAFDDIAYLTDIVRSSIP